MKKMIQRKDLSQLTVPCYNLHTCKHENRSFNSPVSAFQTDDLFATDYGFNMIVLEPHNQGDEINNIYFAYSIDFEDYNDGSES